MHNGYIRYDKNFMACTSKEKLLKIKLSKINDKFYRDSGNMN